VATGTARVGSITIGGGAPLALIAGPCVIESREAALRHAERLRDMAAAEGLPLIYKSSFDKANRTALASFRGVGMEDGLRVLADVRRETGLPVLTDVHEREQIAPVAAVVDVLQTPAFLCRQTDFIVAVAGAGRPVNLKKGQFLSPWEMQRVVEKARSTGNADLLVTERGFAFGYNNLVSDMRALPVLAESGCPVVFDATHSPAPGAPRPAATVRWWRRWPARRSPREPTRSFSRCTRIPSARCPTARPASGWTTCPDSCASSGRSRACCVPRGDGELRAAAARPSRAGGGARRDRGGG